MPRTAQIASFGWDRLSRRGGELRSATARQVLPALGIALMVASALLCLALLTYNPGDPSLDTATAAPPRNYLGHFGALVADMLLQYLGLAAYLLPVRDAWLGLWVAAAASAASAGSQAAAAAARARSRRGGVRDPARRRGAARELAA